MLLASFPENIFRICKVWLSEKSHKMKTSRRMKWNHVFLANEEPHDFTFSSCQKIMYHRQAKKGDSRDLAEWPIFSLFCLRFFITHLLGVVDKV